MARRGRLLPLPVAAAALWATAAVAQDAPEAETVLDTLVVTASPGGEGADARGLVDADALAGAYQGAGLATVLDGIAGVTTATSAGDPAIAVNIRGLSGQGRTVVTIDGARQNFARSDHGVSGSFYLDPEMLRSVAVVRGTTGTDAAPGAIGGTVALRTLEAGDLLAPGATQGGEARVRTGTLTAEPTLHAAYARTLGERATGLVAVTRAEASDYDAGDGARVEAAESLRSGLAKFGFTFDGGQALTLGYSALSSDFRTGTTSGYPRRNAAEVSNATLAYQAGPAELTLYRSETDLAQQSLDAALAPTGPWRSYDTTTDGLRAASSIDVALGPTDHTLGLVAEAFRDTVTTDDPAAALTGGSLTPSGKRRIASLLAEDSVQLGLDTRVALSLRYLDYALDSPDGAVSDTSLSPAVTLERRVLGGLVLYGTLARASRPPTLSESLVNGSHPPPATFDIRPNPTLSPERALTTEIGATLALADLIVPGDSLDARLAVYRNDVDDFIGLVQRGTLFDAWFQYENIDKVRIEGVELDLAYDADRVFGSLSGQIMAGENRTTGGAVSGVPPSRLVLTGGLRDRDRTLEAGARLSVTTARADGTLSSAAWTTLDLFLTRDLGPNARLGLALNNITGETYTPYLTTEPAPGFNALASMSITF
ncbi:MAG: TonB-dependent receptor [Amaricoccus sp.]|uniref:TonB-dependent receptor domain-containing protein n=1 Tax=Amaricoccus sp. TaxID=1872485 RepID=UPI0039E29577